MDEKSVVIIGAGIAGLSAGCYARMNGLSTMIFEHHAHPGGVASSWRRKEFLFDGGIHFMMGHKPGSAMYKVYEELGLTSHSLYTDLSHYLRFKDEVSGTFADITQDLDKLASDLKKISPGDSKLVDELINGARAMTKEKVGESGLAQPPELTGFISSIKFMWNMRPLLKYYGGKFAKPVQEYVQRAESQFIRDFLSNLFLPEVPVWFIMMLLSYLEQGQLGLLTGGCEEFVKVLERKYLSLGGEIRYKSTVDKILVEENHAVGIRLEDGSVHKADYVISAADGYSTIFSMLGGQYLNDRIKGYYTDWRLFRPIITINFALNTEYGEEPHFQTIMLKDPFAVNANPVHFLSVRLFNYSERFAPKGKSVLQVMLETEWDYWNDLARKSRPRYDAEKERVVIKVHKRLESHFPGLGSHIELKDISTPYTMWKYTLNHKGSWEGWLMTPEAIMTQMKRSLPGLSNFLMAGQWVMPGGGVVPCLFSGRHAIQLLCKREKRSFKPE